MEAWVRCRFRKPDGTRCRGQARRGKQSCTFHDPDLAAERAEGRRRGGIGRSRPAAVAPSDAPDLPLRTAADVTAALADAFNRVRRGQLDVKVGNCLGLLAGQLLRAIDGGNLAARIETLELVLRQRYPRAKP